MPDTPQHTPHQSDILIVCNPDINCDVIDTEEDYPHRDYFQVRWSNYPHKIAPGQTRKMPRYLAEHYAKHLANHILTKMEEKTGRKGLMQSMVERPKVISQILLGVDTWYLGETETEIGEKVGKMVDQLNPDERPIDLGTVPDPLMGLLKQEPKPVVIPDELPITPSMPVAQVATPEKTSIWDEDKPKPTKKQLLADCEKLGIEVKGTEDIDTLISKIKAF